MPIRSYVATAILLGGVLAVIQAPWILPLGIFLTCWLIIAAVFILIVGGVLKVALGLRTSPWIGIALVSTGILFAADCLIGMHGRLPAWVSLSSHTALSLSLLAAGAGALRLVQTMSAPHAAFRAGYGMLAASALLVSVGLISHFMGWTFTRDGSYVALTRTVRVASALVTYGAFIAAVVLITMRRHIEPWAGVAISLISALLLYLTMMSAIGVTLGRDAAVLLPPVLMLAGGAAIWRLGTVLRTQARPADYPQSPPPIPSMPGGAGR